MKSYLRRVIITLIALLAIFTLPFSLNPYLNSDNQINLDERNLKTLKTSGKKRISST